MYPYLMCSARLKMHNKKAHGKIFESESLFYRIICYGVPSPDVSNGHLFSSGGMSPNRGIDFTCIRLNTSPHKRDILTPEPVRPELVCKGVMSPVGLCHDKKPGGILVESVNYAGPKRPVNVGQLRGVPAKHVDKCVTLPS